MMEQYDVLGFGYAAVDDLLYVSHYPEADSKTRVLAQERQCGGLTATALVAASRLGARCAYCGVLGDDDLSQFVRRRLREEGIGLRHLQRRPEAQPVHSIIIVDKSHHTRTILFDADHAASAGPDWPPESVILSAKVLFIDTLGVETMIRAARAALAAGIPVVADFEAIADHDRFADLVGLANHPIVSLDFARSWTNRRQPAEAAVALWNPTRQAVVITCGAEGCWYVGHDDPQRAVHCPAYKVDAVDTTGCGDVFHGAYAAGLAQSLALPERVELASAAAALKAEKHGGQKGIPTRGAVESFLREQRK